MQNKNVKGIIALVLVTALSFGVILGSKQLAQNNGGNAGQTGTGEVKVVAELDVNGAENIEKAVQTENGYMVTVKTKGYGGDILMNVSFDQDAQTITSVEVLEQSETENLGALIAEDEFLSQFAGVAAPVYLPGMTLETEKAEADVAEVETVTETVAETEDVVLNDGTYTAEAAEEYNGYKDTMTMTVEGGKITSVVWDCVDANGNLKSVQSENGEYVMTEDGPIWKEQAEALAAELVKEQNLSFLTINEEGKTDAVSGVSISVYGFIGMAQECLAQASGAKEAVVLNDGTYTAEAAEEYNGYKDTMTMTVEGGKITSVVWDCVDAEGNLKSVQSENGEYVMTEDGPIWKEQAEALAAELVKEQNLAFLTINEEGKTDAVSGVSISVYGFIGMAEECLAQASGAKEAVVLNDGVYEVEAAEEYNGYKDTMTMTVEGGKITSVVWDCVDAEGNLKSVQSENGEYVMTEDGPIWKEQAEALAAELVKEQNLAFLTINEEGKTDAVSGVSISVYGFIGMAEQCLALAAGEEVSVEETTEEAPVETAPQNGTLVDAVSGATVSSTAAVKGINAAYNFLQSVK